jgi:hypothetical protein
LWRAGGETKSNPAVPDVTDCRQSDFALYSRWSQIWKKNPNLENILQNPRGAVLEFAFCNSQIANRARQYKEVTVVS